MASSIAMQASRNAMHANNAYTSGAREAANDRSVGSAPVLDRRTSVKFELDEKIKKRLRGTTTRTTGVVEYGFMFVDDPKLRETLEKQWFVVHPDTWWKKYVWDAWICIGILWNIVFIPWNVAIQQSSAAGSAFDYVIDAFYLFDMGLNFVSGYYDERGKTQLNQKLIKERYLRSWFIPDFISIIPWELIVMSATSNWHFISVGRILRLLRVPRLERKLQEFMQGTGFRLMRLIMMFCLLVHWGGCFFYFIGSMQDEGNVFQGPRWVEEQNLENVQCSEFYSGDVQPVPSDAAWKYVPEYESRARKPFQDFCAGDASLRTQSQLKDVSAYSMNVTEAQHGRLIEEGISACPGPEQNLLANETYSTVQCYNGHDDARIAFADERSRYTACVYWAMATMLTVGYGDITPITTTERAFTMSMMLLGAVAYAVIFGNIALLINNYDRAQARFRDKIDGMNEFLEFFKVDAELTARARQYVRTLWDLSRSFHIDGVLSDLPVSLQADTYMFLYEPIVSAVPLFQGFNQDFMRAVAMKLTPVVCLPNDYIIREGETGRYMYILHKGRMEVMSGDEICRFAILYPGSFVGEEALLGGTRSASVRAVTQCELYRISRDELNGILRFFPEFGQAIHENAFIRAEEMRARRKVLVIKRGETDASNEDDEDHLDAFASQARRIVRDSDLDLAASLGAEDAQKLVLDRLEAFGERQRQMGRAFQRSATSVKDSQDAILAKLK